MKDPIGDLRVEALRKDLGEFVLEADFSLRSGERAALVGRSGCGKTTLLRLIAGLEPISPPGDGGRIFLGERNLSSLPPQKREVGFVFQEHALFPDLNVFENVTFGLKMRGISKDERRAQAKVWLERIGLANQIDSPVGRLSGGEAQRVAFVRSLIWKPRLLLLDEPFSALDRPLRSVLAQELIRLHELWPAPMLLVSHDELDLQALATVRLEFEESDDRKVRKVRRATS